MRHTILILVFLITFLIANAFSAISVNYVEPVKNGDQLTLQITEVPVNVQVKYIFLMKKNQRISNWREYVLLDKQDLKISPGGVIEGKVTVKQLDVNDAEATLWIVLDNNNMLVFQKNFSVLGDEEETFSAIDAGSFSITDRDGGTFDAADTASATGSGFDPNEFDFLWSFQELDAGDNVVQSTTTTDENLAVDVNGILTGDAVRDGTAFNPNAVKIQLFGFFLGSSGTVTSTNTLPITETNPPDLVLAYAFDLNTIRLVFNESVNEGGDASGNFTISGASVTISDLVAVGSQPTTNWNLTLSSGLSDRGVSGVTIDYTGGSGTDSLADAAGNEVADTTGVAVRDSIPPDVTTLRNSANSAALTIGEFLGSTSYTLRARVASGGNDDTSLDRVEFEGSDNGSSWTNIGTDDTSKVDFEYDWTIGATRYKMLRARAFDNNGNETISTVVGSATDDFNDNFEDTYRAIIYKVVPSSVGASSGALRARLTVALQNNYGDIVNTTGQNLLFRFKETTTTTETWWDAATGGNSFTTQIDTSVDASSDSAHVWYSNTAAGGPYTLTLTEPAGNFTTHNGVVSANGQTITVTVSNIVTLSSPTPSGDSSIDTTGTAGDLTLQADISGGEDSGVGDDFRIQWGFNSSGSPGSYGITRTSPDLTPGGGGTISYTVPAADLKSLSVPYAYMFWWVENLSIDPDATTLDGTPISSTPARLVLNPNLITEVGVGGGDVSGGSITPGQNNEELVSVKYTSDPSAATIVITGLVFDITGSSTVTTSDISNFHLYKDGGTLGQYDSGLDVELASVSFSGGTSANFITFALMVNGTSDYVLVTADVLSGADPSHTLGLKLTSPSSITLQDNVVNGPVGAIKKATFSNLGTSGDVPLPVELSTFSAKAGYGKITLEWETSSELNNEGFYLFRSLEQDRNFEQLNSEIIPGNGNSNTTHSYTFMDEDVNENTTYYYKLSSKDFNGQVLAYSSVVSSTALQVPSTFSIAQNYPNPFNPETHFRFSIAEASRASLKIYNVLGQKIRTIFDNRLFEAGVYEDFSWNATDDFGNPVSNGIYYYEFQVLDRNIRQVNKMLYLK